MKATKRTGLADRHLGFADRAAFDHAVNESADGPIVLLDGETVKGGVEPALRFVTVGGGRIELEAGTSGVEAEQAGKMATGAA